MRTRSNGSGIGAADVDSTQEIQILTAAYSPEFGRSSGGQIRILTKSGTSQFHGAAYDYVRNDVFNANTWTRNHTPGQEFTAPINYNQFGYNMGGPFYIPGKFNNEKSKVFWYWGWGNVNSDPTAVSTFGKITSKTNDVRNLQLSLRLYF